MKRTYMKAFFGTNEAVETAIRIFDKEFRKRYNVYGGRREASYRKDTEYVVIMSYTANWQESVAMCCKFPEYTRAGMEKSFYRKTRNLPCTAEWYFTCDVFKEVRDIEAWRRGEC